MFLIRTLKCNIAYFENIQIVIISSSKQRKVCEIINYNKKLFSTSMLFLCIIQLF